MKIVGHIDLRGITERFAGWCADEAGRAEGREALSVEDVWKRPAIASPSIS